MRILVSPPSIAPRESAVAASALPVSAPVVDVELLRKTEERLDGLEKRLQEIERTQKAWSDAWRRELDQEISQALQSLNHRLQACETKPAAPAVTPEDLQALEKKFAQSQEESYKPLQQELAKARQAIKDIALLIDPPKTISKTAEPAVAAVSDKPASPAAPARPAVSEALEKLSQALVGSQPETKPGKPEEKSPPPPVPMIEETVSQPKREALLARIWKYLNEPAIEIPTKKSSR